MTIETAICSYPGCEVEANGRCNTCKEVFCIKHYVVRGGGYTSNYNECDLCAEKRLEAEKRNSSSRLKLGKNAGIVVLVACLIGGLALGFSSGSPLSGLVVGLFAGLFLGLCVFMFFAYS